MRKVKFAILALLASASVATVMQPDPAHAVCRNFEASHNGTNMLHPTGATGAAVNKLMGKVDAWQREKRLKKVRMSKVRTHCGPWFNKYLLPHRQCVAKARACG